MQHQESNKSANLQQGEEKMFEQSDRFSTGHVILAFFVGALSGVAAALLTAPMTGKETREHIGRFARRSKDRIADLPKAVRDRLIKGKEETRDIMDEGV